MLGFFFFSSIFYRFSVYFWTVNKTYTFCFVYFNKYTILLSEFAIVISFPIFYKKTRSKVNEK